jgi:uncharacterized membrane protein YfcA
MVSTELITLCLASFAAGFVDSIVGGGGLIQLPAFMMVVPQMPLVNLLATNKLVSMSGTAVSAWRFSRQVPYLKIIILPAIFGAFIFSFLGAFTVSLIDSRDLKPLFIVLFILVFFISIRNQHFGTSNHLPDQDIPWWKPLGIGGVIGFYDGFFGPGTGSFLIIAFVGFLGMTFVQGSAYAKVLNLMTNLAAILLFSLKAQFLFQYALPMILFNVGGALLGVRLALLKGNGFVRTILRMMVFLTILKLAQDVMRDYVF